MNQNLIEHDERSTTELVNVLLTTDDEDDDDPAYWDAITALHRRGTEDVFDAARLLCESFCSFEQRIGCHILAQLGGSNLPFASPSFPIVASITRRTEDLGTLASALIAIGFLGDLRGVDQVLSFLDHPNSKIRYHVTQVLAALDEDERSIDGLIRLTTDSSDIVRDWATFGLGSIVDQNTPAIREALFARVFDEDEVTRGEALVGLARRKDQRIIEPLIKELGRYPDAEFGSYSLDAATEIADPRLLPVLTELRQSAGSDDTTFDEAIQRCSSNGVDEPANAFTNV